MVIWSVKGVAGVTITSPTNKIEINCGPISSKSFFVISILVYK